MSRLIFMNLTIDQHWDEGTLKKLFPVRIPSSESFVRDNENLGLFLSREGDVVLGTGVQESFLGFLRQFDSSWGDVLAIRSHPMDFESWKQEIEEKISPISKDKSHLFCAGLSKNEAELAGLLAQSVPTSVAQYQRWNQKSRVVEWAHQMGLKIPETKCMTSKELRAAVPTLDFRSSWVIKALYGSGGGANIVLKSANEATWQYFCRHVSESGVDLWILQKWLTSTKELSVFGNGLSTEASLFQTSYDERGLSYRHAPLTQEKDFQAIQKAFRNLKSELQKESYVGPFGFDVIEHDGDWYLLDVSVRWTKGHLISAARQRFGLNEMNLVVRRFRLKHKGVLLFDEWWQSFRQRMNLDPKGFRTEDSFVIPFLLQGFSNQGDTPKDVSFFVEPSLEKKLEELFDESK